MQARANSREVLVDASLESRCPHLQGTLTQRTAVQKGPLVAFSIYGQTSAHAQCPVQSQRIARMPHFGFDAPIPALVRAAPISPRWSLRRPSAQAGHHRSMAALFPSSLTGGEAPCPRTWPETAATDQFNPSSVARHDIADTFALSHSRSDPLSLSSRRGRALRIGGGTPRRTARQSDGMRCGMAWPCKEGHSWEH